jgi:aspartyl-tRNA(Asn)/glutamyl-tRNA(Gln) amidotransferase subunit B
MEWDAVIGLEVHVQLATRSKIFSGAATTFGAQPNEQACAVDLGLPGVLPVLNEEALNMAIIFGLAIDAELPSSCRFERKNYFYPDLPKGYQTSQLEAPVVGRGHIDIDTPEGTKRVRIHHAHLEEDAGKSLHEDYHGMTGIDLNRAGMPLLEIVSEPDMSSAAEAVAYLKKLHSLIRFIGISDGNMAEGSMRCDANVSIKPRGQSELGTRTELKNINSFRFIEKAIIGEIERQIDLVEAGGNVTQETRLYDADKDETRPMRSKEEANDYRYFPCPDLLPVRLEPDRIARLRDALPELPSERRSRYTRELGLSDYDADVLSSAPDIARYFDAILKDGADAKTATNWVTGELAGRLNKDNLSFDDSPVGPARLADMLKRITDGTISNNAGKKVFARLWETEASADEIIDAEGLKQMNDSGELEAIVDALIAGNPGQVEQYRAGKTKLIGFFVGQVMKATRGAANPGEVNRILKQKLEQ